MRTIIHPKLTEGRVREGAFATDDRVGLNGMFHVLGPCGATLRIVSGSGLGWEHVSVSTRTRCPNWPEMCFIKDLFWNEEETVMQLHPPKSEYINNAEYCLHLWKPEKLTIPLPPSVMVGKKEYNK